MFSDLVKFSIGSRHMLRFRHIIGFVNLVRERFGWKVGDHPAPGCLLQHHVAQSMELLLHRGRPTGESTDFEEVVKLVQPENYTKFL